MKKTEKIEPRPGRRVVHETTLIIWITSKFRQFGTEANSIPWTGVRSLTPEKLDAALIMLRVGSYMMPMLFKAIGERGASYKVLRKWRTEKPFKALMDHFAEEYLEGFFNEYLTEIRLLHEDFYRDTKGNISRKHEALSVRWLSRMLVEANDTWGKLLYEKAFQRLPALIRKEKNPGVIGHLYLLLLICHCRWPQKLRLPREDGKKYREFYRNFMLRLGHDWSDAMSIFATDAAKIYAEAMLVYNLLLHDKLTTPIFKHGSSIGQISLLSPIEEYNLMGESTTPK